MAMPAKTPYAIGDVVGRRVIIGGPESRYYGTEEPKLATCYLCRCECGRESWVQRVALAKGKSSSCWHCARIRTYGVKK